MHAIERLEPVLHFTCVLVECACHSRRIERVTLYRCGSEKIPVGGCKLADLSLDHAPHRFRNVTAQIRQRFGYLPAAVALSNRSPRPQISQEILHEKRTSFSA